MSWMSDYIAGQDADYDRANPPDYNYMTEKVRAQDKEASASDDKSHMDLYLESKDNE